MTLRRNVLRTAPWRALHAPITADASVSGSTGRWSPPDARAKSQAWACHSIAANAACWPAVTVPNGKP